MTYRTFLIAILICFAVIFAFVYPLLTEFRHMEYMRHQRMMNYTAEVLRQCALAWPQKEEHYHNCVNDALKEKQK